MGYILRLRLIQERIPRTLVRLPRPLPIRPPPIALLLLATILLHPPLQ